MALVLKDIPGGIIGGKAQLLGYEFGNRIARMYAVKYPEHVQSLILLACGGQNVSESTERVVSPEMLDRIQNTPRTREFYLGGNAGSGQRFMARLGDKTVRTAARQWDAIFEDGDFFKSGLNAQGLYVSPDCDLVIAFFSTEPSHRIQKYLRPIVTSGLFD